MSAQHFCTCAMIEGGGGRETVTMSSAVARGCSVSPEMCFADVIWTAVSYSEQTGQDTAAC